MLAILGIALVAGVGGAGVIYGSDSSSAGTDKAEQIQIMNDNELVKAAVIGCRASLECDFNTMPSLELLVEKGYLDPTYLNRAKVKVESANFVGSYGAE